MDVKNRLKNLLKSYTISTTINCKAYTKKGEQIASYGENCDYCDMIHHLKKNNKSECQRAYIYGGYQAEKWGEPYIYYCPFGLVNWAVPVLEKEKMKYILVGGPVLMQKPGELLINNILKQNNLKEIKKNEIKNHINEIKVVEPFRVRHLANLMLCISENLMSETENIRQLKNRQQRNIINQEVAETIHELKKAEESYDETSYPFEKENELVSRVQLGDKKEAQKILNEILGIIFFQGGDEFEIVKAKAVELMVVLARASIEVGADLEIIFGLEYIYLKEINEVTDINELSHLLSKVLDRFIESTFTIKNVRNKDIIFKAMNYIRENYDQDISLDEVASEVGLNSSYFSKLFKEEMGISYSDYLNQVRIEASKKLLNEDIALVEVAQNVGFNDQSYFSKVFKKYEGISPGKWRKGIRENTK
ncbi:MAG: PocR ligand-binding domain-containing protein [Bacillota bacterium]